MERPSSFTAMRLSWPIHHQDRLSNARRRLSLSISTGQLSPKLIISITLIGVVALGFTQVHVAHASSGNSVYAPFAQVTFGGQQNATCTFNGVNVENTSFVTNTCVQFDNVNTFYAGAVGFASVATEGNSAFTQGTSFHVEDSQNSNVWVGCCQQGDLLYADVAANGFVGFNGRGDSGINIIINQWANLPNGPGCGGVCYAPGIANTWEYACYAWAFEAGQNVCNGSVVIQPWTRFYFPVGSSINGWFEFVFQVVAASFAQGDSAASNFWGDSSHPFYAAVLDFGWVHPSAPAPPTQDGVHGIPNGGAYTSGLLCWYPVNDIALDKSYDVQIASDSGMTNIVSSINRPVSQGFCVNQALSQGQYYWRVRDNDVLGDVGTWSSTWSFIIDKTPPPAPVLVSPTNGATVNSGRATLTWNAVTDLGSPPSGTAYYNVLLDRSSACITTQVCTGNYQGGTLTGTSIPSSSSVSLFQGTWYWGVQAVDRAGNAGPWSAPFSFLDTADYSVSVSPASVYVLAGSSPALTITVASSNGYFGSVALSEALVQQTGTSCGSSCPVVAISPSSGTLTANGSFQSTLSISTTAFTPSGQYAITLTATSGSLTHTFAVQLTVNGDFSITSSSSNPSGIAPGGSSSSLITVRSLGFTGTVSFSTSAVSGPGCPGSTCPTTGYSPGSVSLSPGSTATSTLTIGTLSSTQMGAYAVTVAGTSGSLSHTTTVNIQVGNFTVSSSPTSTTVNAGTSGSSTITVGALAGFTGTVALSQNGGSSCSLSPTSLSFASSGSGTSTLTCNFATGGTYVVTVTGTSGSTSHSATVTYLVSDFSLTDNPTSQTITLGGEQQTVVTVSSIGGFSGTVNLVVNVPSGISCWFTTLNNHSSVTVSSGGSASEYPTCTGGPAGQYTVTITATSGSATRTLTLPITITDYSMSQMPSVSFRANTVTNGTITLSSLQGFSGAVFFSTNNNAGLNVSCPGNGVTVPANGSVNAVCTFSSSTPGTYSVTITGVSYPCCEYYPASVTHSITLTVTVTGVRLSNDPTNAAWTIVANNWALVSGKLDGSGVSSEIATSSNYASDRIVSVSAKTVSPGTQPWYSAWIRGKWIDNCNSVTLAMDNGANMGLDLSVSQGCTANHYGATTNLVNTAWHTVMMVFTGNEVKVYIDGTLYIDATDSFIGALGAAKVALASWGPSESQFDGLTIS